jgi:hypothetical protein
MQMLAGLKTAILHLLTALVERIATQALLTGSGEDAPAGRSTCSHTAASAIARLRKSLTGYE